MMRARADDDSSIFIVDWQWVNAEDVPDLPFPIAFGSSHFDPEPFDDGQVGEVRQAFYPKAGSFLPEFLLGKRYCGTQEQWQYGGFDPASGCPIVDGVPVCCVDDDGAPFDFGFEYGFES